MSRARAVVVLHPRMLCTCDSASSCSQGRCAQSGARQLPSALQDACVLPRPHSMAGAVKSHPCCKSQHQPRRQQHLHAAQALLVQDRVQPPLDV